MKLRKNFLIILILTLCLLLSVGTAMAKPVTITFWHAMSGSRLGVLESIIESFNATHPDYEVKPLFTGTYAETLTKYVAAYPTKTGPNMVQVYEVGTQTMIDSETLLLLSIKSLECWEKPGTGHNTSSPLLITTL